MFTIFPFETEFYNKHNFKVHYVGNPLMDSIAEFQKVALKDTEFTARSGLDKRPVVALLAGSRVQEIKRTLPLMIKVSRLFPDFQFVVAGVQSVGHELYKSQLEGSDVKVIFDQTYNLLNNAHTALVASGTAALETALFNVPQTVIYKVEGGWLVDLIMRNFVLKTIGVSLPNIIMNEIIITELIQKKMTLKNVEAEMKKLLYDENYRKKIKADYSRLNNFMGEPGSSKRAAEKMVELTAPSNFPQGEDKKGEA